MSLGFSVADAETMRAMLAAVAQPPPPRSLLGDRNAGEQPLAKPARFVGTTAPPAPSVAKPPPPREPACREFSPTAVDVADADAALKKMEAELEATREAPPAPPAPASSPQRGKRRLSYASTRDAARRARNGQRPATRLRDVATVRPSLGDHDPGPAWPLLAPSDTVEEQPRKKRKTRKKRKGDHGNGIDSLGRRNAAIGQAWGNAANPRKYIECSEDSPNNPGPAVPGAEELVAEEVPEACLDYPDYKEGRGLALFLKGKNAQAFYKANGYWKIAVNNGHHPNSSKAVFKFFKEVERA